MPAAAPARSPSRRQCLLAGALTLLTPAARAASGNAPASDDARARALMLLARVAQAHASELIASADRALADLADGLLQAPNALGQHQALQGLALQRLPFLHGLALLDMQGRVLASTRSAELGRRADLAQLLPSLVQAGPLAIGPWQAGRLTEPPAAPDEGFIPLLRRVQWGAQGSALLVAQLRPSALAHYQEQLLAGSSAGTTLQLALDDGSLLAQTPAATPPPGPSLRSNPEFAAGAMGTAEGHYEPSSGAAWGAWSRAAQWPLLAVATQPAPPAPTPAPASTAPAAAPTGWGPWPWLGAPLLLGAGALLWRQRQQRQQGQHQQLRNQAQQEMMREVQEQMALAELQALSGQLAQQSAAATPVPDCTTAVHPIFAPAQDPELERQEQDALAQLQALSGQLVGAAAPASPSGFAPAPAPLGHDPLETCDLRELIENMATELSPQLEDKQLPLKLQLGREPLPVRVDPEQLAEVLRHVLGNAIRYSPEGRTIHILAEATQDTRDLHLYVHDQGPGFGAGPPMLLPGPRLAGQLNLAACRSIVQEHGGQLDAANDPAGGASVHIRLPLQS